MSRGLALSAAGLTEVSYRRGIGAELPDGRSLLCMRTTRDSTVDSQARASDAKVKGTYRIVATRRY